MNQDFMDLAIKLSKEKMLQNAGGPFGAVIVLNGKVIGEGWNQVTSTQDPTAHAEVVAIRNACKNVSHFKLTGSVLYTSCEPCPMCLAAVYWSRISKIYFACSRKDAAEFKFDDDFIYQEIPKPISERLIPISQMQNEKAIEAFHMWNTKEDKIRY